MLLRASHTGSARDVILAEHRGRWSAAEQATITRAVASWIWTCCVLTSSAKTSEIMAGSAQFCIAAPQAGTSMRCSPARAEQAHDSVMAPTSNAVLLLSFRKVKAAGWWQPMQTALSLHTLSARGTRLITFSKGLRW